MRKSSGKRENLLRGRKKSILYVPMRETTSTLKRVKEKNSNQISR